MKVLKELHNMNYSTYSTGTGNKRGKEEQCPNEIDKFYKLVLSDEELVLKDAIFIDLQWNVCNKEGYTMWNIMHFK